MQLNFLKRFSASVLFIFTAIIFTYPQTEAQNKPAADAAPPSSADVMRDRISKAKAHIVVKNYNAAIYELENIQRETSDQALNSVVNVLLMHSFLEQNDYSRAQDFLKKFYKDVQANNAFATSNYYAVAGQIVKGARTQLERYRGIGLSISDRNLPLEALVDIDKMRETLEIVVAQNKELGADKKHSDKALPLLEEAVGARALLAKDDYDANRWKREVTEARESLADTRTTIIDATVIKPETENQVASNVASNVVTAATEENVAKTPEPTAFKSVANNETPPQQTKPAETNSKSAAENTAKAPEKPKETPAGEPRQTEKTIKPTETVAGNAENPTRSPNRRQRIVVGEKPTEEEKKQNVDASGEETAGNAETAEKTADGNEPMKIGSLVEYATKRVNPAYPSMARSVRQTGVVRVEFVVDEQGNVVEISNTSGPAMLKGAAETALKKWQFKPFLKDGVPVKAVGFVNFNFSL